MIEYPEILDGIQPRVRILSSYEQRLELTPDKNWQYLLFAAEPYNTIAFKIPNLPIEREVDPSSGKLKYWTNWDAQKKIFSLQLYFKRPAAESSTKAEENYESYENPEM